MKYIFILAVNKKPLLPSVAFLHTTNRLVHKSHWKTNLASRGETELKFCKIMWKCTKIAILGKVNREQKRHCTACYRVTSVVIVGPSRRAAAETADTEPAILREIVAVDMTTVIIRLEERLMLCCKESNSWFVSIKMLSHCPGYVLSFLALCGALTIYLSFRWVNNKEINKINLPKAFYWNNLFEDVKLKFPNLQVIKTPPSSFLYSAPSQLWYVVQLQILVQLGNIFIFIRAENIFNKLHYLPLTWCPHWDKRTSCFHLNARPR